jgi:hypothetical protein
MQTPQKQFVEICGRVCLKKQIKTIRIWSSSDGQPKNKLLLVNESPNFGALQHRRLLIPVTTCQPTTSTIDEMKTDQTSTVQRHRSNPKSNPSAA